MLLLGFRVASGIEMDTVVLFDSTRRGTCLNMFHPCLPRHFLFNIFTSSTLKLLNPSSGVRGVKG